MSDYTTVRERTELYAELSGLSRNKANEFRRLPTSQYSHRGDRQISRTIRGLERLYRDEGTTYEIWLQTAKAVLHEVSEFLDGLISTVERFTARVARAVERAWDWFEKMARKAGKLLDDYPWWKDVPLSIMAVTTRAALESASREA